ncbi:MAG: hypothetical protein H7282_03180 [Cytophagaceae bacterium]|nr:hypothetical protein [Cytophagaceae bacterium]
MIFDIFVHLNGEQKENRYGAGLAYCRKIIHNHGGDISAEVIPDLVFLFLLYGQ